MKIKSIFNSSYLGWLVIIGALIFWYVFYFFSYVPNQESKLRERGFRILNEFARNMLEKHEYYHSHFENYGQYYHLREHLDTLAENGNQSEKSLIESKLEKAVKIAEEGLNKNIHRRDSLAGSEFQKLGYNNSNNPSFYYNHDEHKEAFIVPVDIFMQGLKFDRLFESIVLFDSTEVYHNTASKIIHDITDPTALLDSAKSQQGGFTEIIQVRGEKKRVLVLPVDMVQKRFYLAGVISDSEFQRKTRSINFQILILIAGLLMVLLVAIPILKIKLMDPYDHLNASDTQMAALSMVVSTGILVLITIGLMHHKIVDRHNQKNRLENISETIYRNVDDDLTMIIDFYKDFSIKRTDTFHHPLTANVQDVLFGEQGYQKFERTDTLPFPLNEMLLIDFYKDFSKTDTNSFKYPLSAKVQDVLFEEGGYQKFEKNDVLPFPMNEILLIDSVGIVRNALSTTDLSERDTTWDEGVSMSFNLLDLNQRLYFRNAIDTTKSWYRKKDRKHVYIQSIMSYNTGGKEAAISFYLKKPNDNASAVVAITTEFPTFYKQVLPADVEFAIVDPQGDVLFHSIPHKNLHENFLNESNLNPQLLSAVRLRIVENTRVNYNEKPWLIRIKPIEDTPLMLITMLDIQQMQKRNSRVILFTFYFFVLTLFVVFLKMLLVQVSKPSRKRIDSESWFFNWLAFQPAGYMRYKFQLLVITLVLAGQAGGGFFIQEPVTMLIYQLLFIVFSIFISYIVLANKKLRLNKFYKKDRFSTVLMLTMLGLIFAALIKLSGTLWYFALIPLVYLIAVYVLVRKYSGNLKMPENADHLQNYPAVPFRLLEKRHITGNNYKPRRYYVRNVYNFCLFFWLLSLSFVPVSHYYRTIQWQEEEIWQRVQMMHVAERNLTLAKELEMNDSLNWIKRIQGNGIDDMVISYEKSRGSASEMRKSAEDTLTTGDQIYRLLADPLTDGDQHMSYLKEHNFHREWHLDVDSAKLRVSSPETLGEVTVVTDSDSSGNNWRWLLFAVPGVIILILLWFVLNYVNKYTLATKKYKWNFKNSISLSTLLKEIKSQRILLYTFNEKRLERKAIKEAKAEIPNKKFRILPATNLLDGDYPEYLDKGTGRVVWVSDIEVCVPRIEKHEELLKRLLDLIQKAEGQIILPLPFDVEFIHEFYEDYIRDNKIEGEDKTRIYKLRRIWDLVFKGFERYYIPDLKEEKDRQAGFTLHSIKKQFYLHIWNNLCRNEKLVLYDLAEDGLINMKNKRMINRLINKGLVVPKQYLSIYSNGFEYFINNSVEPGEKKALQKSATFKGMWHNIRYPIMFVLVVVVAFVFISQGYSFEKVTAVFAGILTLIATMTKLFEGK